MFSLFENIFYWNGKRENGWQKGACHSLQKKIKNIVIVLTFGHIFKIEHRLHRLHEFLQINS